MRHPSRRNRSSSTNHQSYLTNNNFRNSKIMNQQQIDVAVPQNEASASPLTWKVIGNTLLWLNAETQNCSNGGANLKSIKIAGFDMDDTLITPKGKRVFSLHSKDWQWLPVSNANPTNTFNRSNANDDDEDGNNKNNQQQQRQEDAVHPVVAKLRLLAAQGFTIVIFTNQAGVGMNEVERSKIREKIIAMNASAQVPLSACAATMDDEYRKPCPLMWKACEEAFKESGLLDKKEGKIDLEKSFYVGDAAGRKIATLAGRAHDFSCGDRKFAYNVGVRFLTPEEFFCEAAPVPLHQINWHGLSPDQLFEGLTSPLKIELVEQQGQEQQKQANDGKNNAVDHINVHKNHNSPNEMVIMVGIPGSGKSTFAKNHFPAHTRVNRDTLKTPIKCLEVAEDALRKKCSVVVDNTNPGAEARKPYLQLAQKYDVPVRAVIMRTSDELARHLAKFRELYEDEENGGGVNIPKIAVNLYKKTFEPPSCEREGFVQVLSANASIAGRATNISEEEQRFLFQLL